MNKMVIALFAFILIGYIISLASNDTIHPVANPSVATSIQKAPPPSASSIEAPKKQPAQSQLSRDLIELGVETSYYAGNSLFVMDNLAKRYFDAISRTGEDSPDAWFTVYMSLNICQSIQILNARFISTNEKTGEVTQANREAPKVLKDAARATLRDCKTVEASIAEHDSGIWGHAQDSLRNASKAGSRIANYLVYETELESSYRLLPQSDPDAASAIYQDKLDLLQRALAEGHYSSFYLAYHFIVANHHSDGDSQNHIEAFKWLHTVCTKHVECNPEEQIETHREQFLPRELEEAA